MRSATSLRMVASARSEPSACWLFLTVRAANPAVTLPSTKRARVSAAHTVAVSSAESTWPITICIRAPWLAVMIGARHRTCNRDHQARVRIAAARGGLLEPFKTTTLLDGFGVEIICIRRGAEMAMWHPRRKRGRWISGGLSRPSARLGSSSGFHMKTKRKIWLGVGAFVIAGAGAAGVAGPLAAPTTLVPDDLPGAATEPATPLTPGRNLL